jgi:hypothetical protein
LSSIKAKRTLPRLSSGFINANYPGIRSGNIPSAYARAKQHGAITVSEGGIIDFHKGGRR